MMIKQSHKGMLHKALHVKQGNHISLQQEENRLSAAKKDHNVKLERELVFAINARHFNKK
jgi:hypothetical protein